MTLRIQVVPSEPSQLKLIRIGPVQPSTGTAVVNNGKPPTGRCVTKALRLVLADKFGNTVVGAPANGLQLLAELREAEDSQPEEGIAALPGDIRPLDVQFFFCNDASRVKQVSLLPFPQPWVTVGVGQNRDGEDEKTLFLLQPWATLC